MDTPVGFLQVVQTGGLVGALVLFLYGFYKRWWIQGSLYEETVSRLEGQAKAKEDLITQKDEEIARLNEFLAEEVVPAIIRFTYAQAEVVQRRARPVSDDPRRGAQRGAQE